MAHKVDITNKKFFKLTAIKWVSKGTWLFKCDCGNNTITRTSNVRHGLTTSCGCRLKEIQSTFRNKPIHGMTKTRFYKIWKSMRQRCYNNNSTHFHRWGGRGIKICDRWSKFLNFKKDMFLGYQKFSNIWGEKNTKIDRIDNNGNYSPENCKWSTNKEQARNRRNNHFINYHGEIKTIAEWSEKLGFSYCKLYSRIRKGWTIEDSINTP